MSAGPRAVRRAGPLGNARGGHGDVAAVVLTLRADGP